MKTQPTLLLISLKCFSKVLNWSESMILRCRREEKNLWRQMLYIQFCFYRKFDCLNLSFLPNFFIRSLDILNSSLKEWLCSSQIQAFYSSGRQIVLWKSYSDTPFQASLLVTVSPWYSCFVGFNYTFLSEDSGLSLFYFFDVGISSFTFLFRPLFFISTLTILVGVVGVLFSCYLRTSALLIRTVLFYSLLAFADLLIGILLYYFLTAFLAV